jgi:selenocysteine-specific elongation factor
MVGQWPRGAGVQGGDTNLASIPYNPAVHSSPGILAARHCILGTAGHIDHGKTSLVRALTGIDTDRLPEERRRGMTIELGFAAMTIGDTLFGVVDVPGHERFVRTMVAGATGIDIAVLVVAADDSVMPQTIEHVEILNLLGVRRAVVALTKIDMVDASMVELVAEELGELLANTSLAGAPICPVSSVTGEGIESLKQAIAQAAGAMPRGEPAPPFRMAVDRAFVVQGRGTVVTGSVLRGVVTGGDTLEIWPGGRSCRVRDLQAHGAANTRLVRGQRAALNLSGVDREDVERGVELATPGYLQPSKFLDVRVRALSRTDRIIRSPMRVRLEMGTREMPVRVILHETDALSAGESSLAQLRSRVPLTAAYGQRFILRDETASRTLGGGVVLRPAGLRKRKAGAADLESLRRLEDGDADTRVREVLRGAGFGQPGDLQICAGAGVEWAEIPAILARMKVHQHRMPFPGTQVLVVPETLEDLSGRLVAWLERHHRDRPDSPGKPVDAVLGWLERVTKNRTLARPLLDHFQSSKNVKLIGRFVGLPAFAPAISAADENRLAALIDRIRAGRFQPVTAPEFAEAHGIDRKRMQKLLTLAVAQGELVSMDGTIYLHSDAEAEMRQIVARCIADNNGATVAQIREALESSRKFVVPFVEYLDRVGWTKRCGDVRTLEKKDDP